MRIAIIGGSVAGASAALLFAGNAEVSVYEQKRKEEIGKKTCANIVSKTFSDVLKKIGIKEKRKFFRKKINQANFFAGNAKLSFSVKDYKIDRTAFLDEVVSKAKKKGARFYFETEFLGFKKRNDYYELTLKSGKDIIKTYADIIIGADGALSRVAEFIKKKRKFFIVSEIPKKDNFEHLKFDESSWNVFLRPEFGYYAYLDYEFAGVECRLGKSLKRYEKNFFSFLEIKKPRNLEASLEPEPGYSRPKGNVFLIGDAGGYVKFNGGGIVPAIMSSIAVRDIILKRNYKLFRKLEKAQFVNRIATKVFEKMDENDWKKLFEILRDKKFSRLVEERDEINFIKYFDLKLLKFLPKIIC